MKLAVTYENGQVFQHFGHTEQFKIYDIQDGKILDTEIMSTEGTGHEALAEFLKKNDISAVICGGLGEGAKNALSEAGISVFSGAQGDADAAVSNFLNGTLTNAGVNCDHHHEEEEHSCHCHDQNDENASGCSGGCSHCGGGCGAREVVPDFDGPNVGHNVKVNYEGTLDDGTKFDSSYDRGTTLDFLCGAGMMIHGFDKAVATMKVGEIVNVHLDPADAYGEKNPDAIITVTFSDLPGSEDLSVGDHVYLSNQFGQQIPVTVTDKGSETITFDANHELAGKSLNFKIELVEVE